jgi:hypothetical protein
MAGKQGVFTEYRAEVTRARIGDHTTWVVALLQVAATNMVPS